jgi:hypothetical protein
VVFDYEATLETAVLIDQRGLRSSVNAIGGRHRIELPGATANRVSYPNDYLIGGEPYLVIEEDTVAPSRATLDPLPSTTYTDAIAVSWSASDDDAGVWGFEVQVRRAGSGGWSDWLGLSDTEGISSARYAGGERGATYCFRARAWDRAGNLGPWSSGDTCTTLAQAQQVRVSVDGVFGDADGDGTQSAEEPSMSDISFRLVDQQGHDVVTPVVGSGWSFTTTLQPAHYELRVSPSDWPSPPPGWLPRRFPIVVQEEAEPLVIEHEAIGLLPHHASTYFPLMAREN